VFDTRADGLRPMFVIASPHFSYSLQPALGFGELDTGAGREKRIGSYG
jgi:hypothetical protein